MRWTNRASVVSAISDIVNSTDIAVVTAPTPAPDPPGVRRRSHSHQRSRGHRPPRRSRSRSGQQPRPPYVPLLGRSGGRRGHPTPATVRPSLAVSPGDRRRADGGWRSGSADEIPVGWAITFPLFRDSRPVRRSACCTKPGPGESFEPMSWRSSRWPGRASISCWSRQWTWLALPRELEQRLLLRDDRRVPPHLGRRLDHDQGEW